MGIINITPDSFSDGGLYFDPFKADDRASELLNQGADIIDIGAQSTRPGAEFIDTDEELRRLLPALNSIKDKNPSSLLSVDTFNAEVAFKALEQGANWINDVTAGRRDPDIFRVVSDAKCPYVLTHSRGTSKNMNKLCVYDDLIPNIIEELSESTNEALKFGISEKNIIWDPGLGFAKDTEQNLTILKELEVFTKGNFPILIGPSRKRFIGDVISEPNARKRIWGTNAVVCRCVQAGVSIVRVHDVKEVVKTIDMAKSLW